MTMRSNDTVATDLAPLIGSANALGIPNYLLIDLAGNVAVFVPLGIALVFALRTAAALRAFLFATLLGAALSLAIELLQAAIPGRVAALDDWLLNTTGAALGAALGCLARAVFRRDRERLPH